MAVKLPSKILRQLVVMSLILALFSNSLFPFRDFTSLIVEPDKSQVWSVLEGGSGHIPLAFGENAHDLKEKAEKKQDKANDLKDEAKKLKNKAEKKQDKANDLKDEGKDDKSNDLKDEAKKLKEKAEKKQDKANDLKDEAKKLKEKAEKAKESEEKEEKKLQEKDKTKEIKEKDKAEEKEEKKLQEKDKTKELTENTNKEDHEQQIPVSANALTGPNKTLPIKFDENETKTNKSVNRYLQQNETDTFPFACDPSKMSIVQGKTGSMSCTIQNDSPKDIEMQLNCSGFASTGIECLINKKSEKGTIMIKEHSEINFRVVVVSKSSVPLGSYSFKINAICSQCTETEKSQ